MYYAKLSIPGKQNTELSYIFVDSLNEQQNGSILLFGLFDIKSTSEFYHTIIKQAVKHFLDFYHIASPFESLANEDLPDSSEFIFEHSIQYAYEKVSDALRDIQELSSHRQAVDLKKINCILGAIMNDTLYLSVTGTSFQPMLIYPVMHRNGPVQYMLVNILGSNSDQSSDAHARLFSQLVSGPVNVPSSSIIICNQTFLDYISAQQIKHAISNSKIQNIIPYFEHLLSRVNARSDFSALLIARDSAPAAPPRLRGGGAAGAVSSSSMQGLNGTAESTRSILAPTMRPMLVHALRGIIGLIALFVRTLIRLARKAVAALTSSEQKRRYRSFFETLWRNGNAIAGERLRSLFQYFRSGSARSRIREKARAPLVQGKKVYQNIRPWFVSLNPVSRSLFVLSVIFIVLFLVSLLSIQLKNMTDKQESRAAEILAAVEQKEIAADASLIYYDKARARNLLNESKNLFALIDKRFRDREDYKKIAQALESIELKIYNITKVDDPTQIAAISALPPDLEVSALRLATADTSIFAYSKQGFYQYEREKKEFTQLMFNENTMPGICANAVSEQQVLVCIGATDRITAIAFPEKTIKTYQLKGAGKGTPSALFLYNNRLYIFSSETGELFKFTKNENSFSNGTAWFRSSATLEQLKGARDIALDGLVYVLTRDGALAVFRSGKRHAVVLPDDTASALKKVARIYTNENLDYLYALDSENKKIIIINKKTFEVIAQIISGAFQNPSDVSVSKKRKALLVLDQGKLFSIPFEVK